jgi:hypothetical protein
VEPLGKLQTSFQEKLREGLDRRRRWWEPSAVAAERYVKIRGWEGDYDSADSSGVCGNLCATARTNVWRPDAGVSRRAKASLRRDHHRKELEQKHRLCRLLPAGAV